jgi:hypothetical protein
MLSENQSYFPYWLNAMKFCNLFFSIPYKWDVESKKVKIIGRKSKVIYQFLLLTHVLYIFVMSIHVILNHDKMKLANILKGIVSIFVYATCACSRLTFWFWEKEGLKMFNGILDFEKNLLAS